MEPGLFICVVGPSGSGKDTLIDGVRGQVPDSFVFAKRSVTREAGKPGEIYDSHTVEEFLARERAGEFLITWQAHGLHYGLSQSLLEAQLTGKHIIANGSRTIAAQLQARVPNLIFIEVTAPVPILADRILRRGRETRTEIERRLTRASVKIPAHVKTITIQNDLTVQIGVTRFMSVIRHLCKLSSGDRALVDKKIAGLSLNASEMAQTLALVASKQLSEAEQQTLLVSYIQSDTALDLCNVTKARQKAMHQLRWPEQKIVDFDRIGAHEDVPLDTLVTSTVAAHGLTVPHLRTPVFLERAEKAATDDFTKAGISQNRIPDDILRTRLDLQTIRATVQKARGCVACGAVLLEDAFLDLEIQRVGQALNLPLAYWSLARLFAIKTSVGITHLVLQILWNQVDLIKTRAEALELSRLAYQLGQFFKIKLRVHIREATVRPQSTQPPISGTEDVKNILKGCPTAPSDLRDRAILLAAQVIAMATPGTSLTCAQETVESLWQSGVALQTFILLQEHQN